MPPYTFDWSGDLPIGVTVADSGLLVGVPHELGTFNYTVEAEDFLVGDTGPVPFTLAVVPPAIGPAPPTSPIYTGQDFSHTFTTTPGTIGSRTFSVSAGAVPPGLTLSPPGLALTADGALSGTPSAAGTYDFVVRASGAGSSADRDTTIVITPVEPTATGVPSPSPTSPTNAASPTSHGPRPARPAGHGAEHHLADNRRRVVARRRHGRDAPRPARWSAMLYRCRVRSSHLVPFAGVAGWEGGIGAGRDPRVELRYGRRGSAHSSIHIGESSPTTDIGLLGYAAAM